MKGHIQQRGKAWLLKYDIGPDPVTGKRRQRYHTVHGTKREAQAELAKRLAQVAENTHADPARITVKEYLERWLDDYAQHNVSAKTLERYREIVDKHLVPALGTHRLGRLAPTHIQGYYTQALDAGRRDGKGGLSKQTVKHHHRVLSQAMAQAVRWQLLPRNPCEAVNPPRPDKTEMQWLSQEETGQLLRAAEGRWVHLPVLLAVTTGLRRGEVLALRWRDVDLEAGILAVTQTLEETAKGLAFKQPKTARSRRRIKLWDITIEALRQHKVSQAKARLKAGPAYEDHGLVCGDALGRPVRPRELTKAFNRLVTGKANAVRQVRFHDLRHTHISHLLQAGEHPKVVSDRAGHASVAITLDVYAHVAPAMESSAGKALDAALQDQLEQGRAKPVS